MPILKNFDLDAVRRERQRKAAGSGVDLVAGLNQISANIANLKVGETDQIQIPNYKTLNKEGRPAELRKFVMSITAKLNNLTPKDGEWEGRQYKVLSDGERYVYVARGANLKADAIPARKRAGRKAADAPATAGAPSSDTDSDTTSKTDSGALVTEHA